MPGERIIGPSFDPDGPGYEVGRCTCDPGPEGQHQWHCGHDPEDEPSRAERWGITDKDLAEAGLLEVGYLLEEDQPWRSGGVLPGE